MSNSISKSSRSFNAYELAYFLNEAVSERLFGVKHAPFPMPIGDLISGCPRAINEYRFVSFAVPIEYLDQLIEFFQSELGLRFECDCGGMNQESNAWVREPVSTAEEDRNSAGIDDTCGVCGHWDRQRAKEVNHGKSSSVASTSRGYCQVETLRAKIHQVIRDECTEAACRLVADFGVEVDGERRIVSH